MKTAGLSRARDIRMHWKEMQTWNSLWGSWPTPSLSLFEWTLLYLQCTLLSFIHGLSYYMHRLDTTDAVVQYLHKYAHTLYTWLSMPVTDTHLCFYSIFGIWSHLSLHHCLACDTHTPALMHTCTQVVPKPALLYLGLVQMEVALLCLSHTIGEYADQCHRKLYTNWQTERYKEGRGHCVPSLVMSVPVSSSQLNPQPCSGLDNMADSCGMAFPRMPPDSPLCSWCKKLMNAITEVEKEKIQVCDH